MPGGGAALEGAVWGAWGLLLPGENTARKTVRERVKDLLGGSLSPCAGFLVSHTLAVFVWASVYTIPLLSFRLLSRISHKRERNS